MDDSTAKSNATPERSLPSAWFYGGYTPPQQPDHRTLYADLKKHYEDKKKKADDEEKSKKEAKKAKDAADKAVKDAGPSKNFGFSPETAALVTYIFDGGPPAGQWAKKK